MSKSHPHIHKPSSRHVPWQTGTKEETRVISDHLPPANTPSLQKKLKCEGTKSVKLTEPRLRLVLMLCFPLSPSSSSLTGLNIKGGGSTGFSIGGSSPYFLKWMRQSVHSKMFSRPPWCQSLEAWDRKSDRLDIRYLLDIQHKQITLLEGKKREKKKRHTTTRKVSAFLQAAMSWKPPVNFVLLQA